MSGGEDDFGSLGFKNRQTRIPLTRRIWNVSHLNGWLWLDWKQRSREFKRAENCLLWKCMQWKNAPSLSSFSTRVDPWLRTNPPSGDEVTLYNGCIMTIKSFFSSSFLFFFLSHSDSLLVPSSFFLIIFILALTQLYCFLMFWNFWNQRKCELPRWKSIGYFHLTAILLSTDVAKTANNKKDLKVEVKPPPNEPQQATNLRLTYQSTYRRNLKPV